MNILIAIYADEYTRCNNCNAKNILKRCYFEKLFESAMKKNKMFIVNNINL
jgi:hypothetical protein